jgi:hypothetical protein
MTEAELFANATSTKKRKPDEVSKNRRQKAITALDKAAAAIKALADRFKLPDLSPHGVEVAKEKAWEAKVLKPVQAQVEAILAKHKAQILALIPGVSVKYRGSLATGWKGPHKLAPDGSALRFDSSPFDCDAFLEIPPAIWDQWAQQEWVPVGSLFVNLADFGGPFRNHLVNIQTAIGQDLGKSVPGYKKVRVGAGKFDFRLQSPGQSVNQIRNGVTYPQGAMSSAGLPETEHEAPRGTAYVNDAPVDGRVMRETHREA